jgi:hypothetical protein
MPSKHSHTSHVLFGLVQVSPGCNRNIYDIHQLYLVMKTLHRKLKIAQHELTKHRGELCAPEGLAVPTPLETPVVLLLVQSCIL